MSYKLSKDNWARSITLKEVVMAGLIWAVMVVLSSVFDLFDFAYKFSRKYENWEIDELLMSLVIFLFLFSIHKWRKARQEAAERRRAEERLQEYQTRLEELVGERTATLIKTNEELQREIAERKQAEEALRKSEEKWRSLSENAPSFIMTIEPDCTIRFLNRAEPGYSVEDTVGKSVYDFVAPEYQNVARETIQQVLETGEQGRYEIEVIVPGVGTYWYETHVGAIKGDEEITGATLISMDISERKQAAEALQETATELEKKARELEEANKELKEATSQLVQSEKMRALGDLTAGMAHELNQPLNGIKIICQSILRDKEKDRLEMENLGQDLSDVVVQVNKMAEIIDHMRVYTRHPEGVPMKKIDMKTVIESPFKLLGQQLRNHNIEVTKELSPGLPVMGDPIRLEQVFVNLITNARSALESSGRADKRIELRAYKDDSRKAVVAEVLDNGTGVPEDLQERIFQPFFTTKEPGEGTGLGLSVASKIIEEHKGKIELESQMGEGTAFRVILPVAE